MMNLKFPEKADRQKIQSCEEKHGGKDHHGAVFCHYSGVIEKFLDEEPRRDPHTTENAQHADRAEEVKRAAEVFQQETNGDEIEEHAESSRDAVVRNTALTVYVADGNFADRRTVPRGERWDEAMQFAVQRHLFENFAAICLKGCTKIVDVNAAQLGHQPVRATGRDASEPQIIDADFAPAADDVIALGNLFQKHRDVGRIVLQIAIHGDDVLAT